MNKVILVGNLPRDPELSTTSSGISLCRLSVAVQRRYLNAEGVRGADFFNVSVWRNQAENCHKYLRKGSKVGIVGTLQSRSYEDKDGVRRYVIDIIADDVEFLSSRPASEEPSEAVEEQPKKPAGLRPVEDDDLPF